jgi:phosphoribosylformimino-5-aminoimidazole carboxamide ribotide isomerase
LQIVPVLDLQGGLVVRAVGGRRREYRPIESRLTRSAQPGDVARAFVQLGLREAYVADLGAIEGAEPDWRAYQVIAEQGVVIHLDAGARSAADLSLLGQFAGQRQIPLCLVVGLETLRHPAELSQLAQAAGVGCAFSLDLRDGRPLVAASAWTDATPAQIADAAIESGFARLIVLDLARVGEGRGVGGLALCAELRRRHPAVSLWVGGGVSGMDDLAQIAEAGCDAALVASALHDGRLSAENLAAFGRPASFLAGKTYNLPCKSR